MWPFSFDEFESATTMKILECIEEKCDVTGHDKPHILGLSTSILKTNCSADDLKSDIHMLEDASGIFCTFFGYFWTVFAHFWMISSKETSKNVTNICKHTVKNCFLNFAQE